MMSPFDDTAGMASDVRAFLRNSGWRLSQPARRSASAVRGDQGSEGLASRERSGRLNGKNARYPKGFRASLFILVTPLLGLRAAAALSNIVPETSAAFANQLTRTSFASKQCQIKLS